MKRLLLFSVLTVSVGCGQSPTERREVAPAGFKQVIIIDENGAHTVTIPTGNISPGLPVAPHRLPPAQEKSGYE